MNITISTKHNQLFRQPYIATDSAISGRHLRDMELYALRSLAPEELLRETADSSGQLWLMFFDSDSRLDWTDVLDRFITYNSQVVACAVSSDYNTAVRLINSRSVRGIAGYIRPTHNNLERSCLNILTYLNRHVNSADGFLVVHDNKQGTWLPLSSIYYIETVKGTHMCNMRCSNGVYAFRSGIKELSERLGPSFRQVRASIVVNLSSVRSSEPNPDILSFTDGISCCCFHSYKHDLSNYSREHPGHTHAERGGG